MKAISRTILPLFLLILLWGGCAENPQRHLDLGRWYYEKGLVNDAILEFKEVIRLLPADSRRMTTEQLELVSKAHYNLAVAYAGKSWFEMALIEARTNFELRPTPDNYDLQELIRRRAELETIEPVKESALF